MPHNDPHGGFNQKQPGYDNGDVPYNERQLCSLLNKYDKDGNHKLDKNELKLAFKEFGAWFPGWNPYVKSAIREMDANGDGVITKEEMGDFVEVVTKYGYKIK